MSLPESTNGSTKPVAPQSGLRAHVSYGSNRKSSKQANVFRFAPESGLHPAFFLFPRARSAGFLRGPTLGRTPLAFAARTAAVLRAHVTQRLSRSRAARCRPRHREEAEAFC